jgi:hypothetical protein
MAAPLIKVKIIQSIVLLFRGLFDALQMPGVSIAAAGQPHRAAWLHHGTNAAAMGSAARQLRAAAVLPWLERGAPNAQLTLAYDR